MFGYVIVNKAELKVREWEEYRAFYCGVCRALGKRSGPIAHAALTYDMTFLAVLLSDLYDDPVRLCHESCPLRPWRRCPKHRNEHIDYASDMNVLLTYYNLLDNWQDDRDLRSLLFARSLRGRVRQIRKEYPRQAAAVTRYMEELARCEQEHSADLDRAAGLTGELLGEIFVYQQDIWAERLRRIGFYLGKYIYLMDAFEDRTDDQKSGSYNPWNLQKPLPREPEIRSILTMMASEAARTFEQLPTVEYAPILRNILYSGLWKRYEEILNPAASGSAGSTCKREDHIN